MKISQITICITCLIILLFCIGGQILAQEDLEDIVFGKHRILKSKILNQDRILYVNLPEGYDQTEESYPVLFQLYSHFKATYYLPAIRTTVLLQSHGEAPGIIVVGIKNKEFRYRDLLPVDHNRAKSEIDNFLAFFEEELIPFIDSNYRTQKYKILAAPQAGAAFGIYSLAKRPKLFNAYFLSSPFWITKAREPLINLIEKGLEQNEYPNKFIMITYRNNLESNETQYLDSLSAMIRDNESFQCLLNPIVQNSDFTAPVGIKKGMESLFKEFKFPGTNTPQELSIIEKHFHKLSNEYGYEVKIPEHGLVYEGDKFVRAGSLEKAKEIFLKMEELYPKSLMAFDRLGSIAIKKGEFEMALKYYNKFLLFEPNNPYAQSKIEMIKKYINN